MVEKKTAKKPKNKISTKAKTTKVKTSKTAKSTKSKSRKVKQVPFDNSGIVIVDDNMEIDQEKINEERRAYLEEARSQETSD